MKILTWNIQQGGGSRIKGILETIARLDPDSLVLTEYRDNSKGAIIADTLRKAGLVHQAAAPSAGENSVFLASKKEFEPLSFKKELGQHAHRCVGAKFADHNLFGFYFPQKEEKYDVFQFILKHLTCYIDTPTALIGDFNTGKHYLDETKATFKCAESFEVIQRKGWIDLWRKIYDRKREYTWYSRAGNGFRIDHAFGSLLFAEKVGSALYHHEPREKKISDHSLMQLDWMDVK